MTHDAAVARLRQAVLEAPGTTDPETRRRAYDGDAGDDPLSEFGRQVHDDATRISDRSVEALRDNGYSEDQIFEVTLAAALGAADLRLRAGLGALDAPRPSA